MSTRAVFRHGAVLEAPNEGAFAARESPAPAAVGARTPDDLPPRGWRTTWSILKLLSGLAIVIGAAVAVAWGAHRYAVTTTRFGIKTFDLRGARRVTVQQIQQRAGIELGHNLFALNVEAAEARLLEDPWVRQVKLTRQLPNTLRVELSEHEPGALAVVGGRLYLLSRQGQPFKVLRNDDPHDLPIVSGVSPESLARDRQGAIRRWVVALEVLRHYERLPLSKMYPPEELHLAESGDVVLTVGASGIALHLGKGPWQKKLRMAARVFERLAQKGRVPGIVFLDNQAHPERVVVRMQ